MRLPFFGNTLVKFRTVARYIPVVLPHESAFQHVIVGHVGEPRIARRFFKPIISLLEPLFGIVDVAQRVSGRGRIVRLRHFFSQFKAGLGRRNVPRFKERVGLLERIFRKLIGIQILPFNPVKGTRSLGIVFFVKEVEPVVKVKLRNQGRIRILEGIRRGKKRVSGLLEPDGAERFIALRDKISRFSIQSAEQGSGSLEHAPFVEIHRAAESFGSGVLSDQADSRAEYHCGDHCHDVFAFHIDSEVLFPNKIFCKFT